MANRADELNRAWCILCFLK